MQGLHPFERFDFPAFSKDKDFTVVSMSEWLDYESKKPLGWKVSTAITRDDTQYFTKDGKIISNLYQPQVFKCALRPDVHVGDVVVPDGDVTCVVFGNYRNQLSIKCSTMRVVTPVAAKGKN